MSTKIAFFGATGGCAGFCLARALSAGYQCSALARTPAKLTASLEEKGVSATALANLRIVQGDVRDIKAVKETLQTGPNQVADKIVSGIGGALTVRMNPFHPVTLTDPTICQSAVTVLLQALQEIQPQKRPLLISISTTGIASHGPRDMPLGFQFVFSWLLSTTFEDKKVLEQTLEAHGKLPDDQKAFSDYVLVKPAVLGNGSGKGLDKVREGTDGKPAVGFGIRRQDVGDWIFERLVKPENISSEWLNHGVSLTS